MPHKTLYIVAISLAVGGVLGIAFAIAQSSRGEQNTPDQKRPEKKPETRNDEIPEFESSSTITATHWGMAGADAFSYQELMKRVNAKDTIGMREMLKKRDVFEFDVGQKFLVIDQQRDRLQIRAVGGKHAGVEMYASVALFVRPNVDGK